jgi:hypothetical protein
MRCVFTEEAPPGGLDDVDAEAVRARLLNEPLQRDHRGVDRGGGARALHRDVDDRRARVVDRLDRDRLAAIAGLHALAHRLLEGWRDESRDRRRDRQLDRLLGLEADALRDRLDGQHRRRAEALRRQDRGGDAGPEDRHKQSDGEQPEAPQRLRKVSECHARIVTEGAAGTADPAGAQAWKAASCSWLRARSLLNMPTAGIATRR